MLVINKFVADDGIVILRVGGKIISSSMEKLKSGLDTVLADNANCKIVINCKDVNIIDSAAVGLLISRAKSARKRGGCIYFCEPQPAIYRLFSMVDADRWLEIFTTEDEAIASLKAGKKRSDD